MILAQLQILKQIAVSLTLFFPLYLLNIALFAVIRNGKNNGKMSVKPQKYSRHKHSSIFLQ